MIVVRTYGKDAGEFSGTTSAIDFEDCKRRLRLYFRNVGKIKAMLYAGKIVSMPFVTLRRDRRIRDLKISNERREPAKSKKYKFGNNIYRSKNLRKGGF